MTGPSYTLITPCNNWTIERNETQVLIAPAIGPTLRNNLQTQANFGVFLLSKIHLTICSILELEFTNWKAPHKSNASDTNCTIYTLKGKRYSNLPIVY